LQQQAPLTTLHLNTFGRNIEDCSRSLGAAIVDDTGAPDTDAVIGAGALQFCEGNRERVEGANFTRKSGSALTPVEQCFLFNQLGCITAKTVILLLSCCGACL